MLPGMAGERQKVPETKGHLQLDELMKDQKQKDFSAKTGIPQSALSEISNRWRLPTLEQGVALQREGIEPVAWTQIVEEPAA